MKWLLWGPHARTHAQTHAGTDARRQAGRHACTQICCKHSTETKVAAASLPPTCCLNRQPFGTQHEDGARGSGIWECVNEQTRLYPDETRPGIRREAGDVMVHLAAIEPSVSFKGDDSHPHLPFVRFYGDQSRIFFISVSTDSHVPPALSHQSFKKIK